MLSVGRRWVMLLLLMSLATGCGISSSDKGKLNLLADYMHRERGVNLVDGTARALVGLELSRSSACQKQLQRLMNSPADMKLAELGQSIGICRFACPVKKSQALGLDGPERMRLLVTECDAQAPDPVFGGNLANRRLEMEFVRYVTLRHLLQETREALLDDGSDEALKIWHRLEVELPRLAEAMVLPPSPAPAH